MLQLRTIFSCLLLVAFNLLNAQELPPIINYTPINYEGGNQNWSITQTQNKFIYVANNDGLLEFNGEKWTLHTVPNNTVVRSVGSVGNTIFSGSYMDFGYWKKDDNNSLNYTSLNTTLGVEVIEDEQFWTILTIGTRVLFQSLNRIYIFNTENNTIKIVESNKTIHKMFQVDNSIYFHVLNEGIYSILDGKKKLISTAQVFKDDTVVGLFKNENQLVAITGNSGFLIISKEDGLPFSKKINETISKLSIYSSTLLNDGAIVLGTISNGLIKINIEGEIDYQINQYTGLGDNTVLSLFEDIDNNLWIGLDNGIDCVNTTSSLANYIDQIGNIGTVYTSISYNGYLYLGTNQGLFYKKTGSKESFNIIANTEGQVWTLKVLDNTLFCGHNKGTFIINEDNKPDLISQIAGTWDIKPLINNPNVLVQGNYNGLHILEKETSSWRYKNKIEGFDISSRYFELINNDKILVSHEYKGVYVVVVDKKLTKVLDVKKDLSVQKGSNSSITTFDSRILYASAQGIFQYYEKVAAFEKIEMLSTLVTKDQYISGKMVVDPENTLWFFTKSYINAISKETLSNDYQIKQLPIPFTLRNEMKGFENIASMGDDKYLFGTSKGYIIIDISEKFKKSHKISLNKVGSGTSKNNLIDVSLISEGIFEAANNYISFEYSIPEYSKYLEAEYSYKLDGSKMNEWSNWSTKPNVSFENLRFGDYTFEVKSRVNNEIIEDTVAYKFQISRPLYLSYLAIAFYLFALIIFILLLNVYYKRMYKKEQQRIIEKGNKEITLKELENQKKIIQLKNEKLNQDIEARNRELAISTMSMIKNNNTLNTLKTDLIQLNNEVNLKPIIKKIDKTLNSNEDWEFFEEAFNHADKDFFKKVKSIHPQLTANDLRLCVYLRLNLSSKEISPLLNISHRSVEIKRYRLRKKINLSREINLNNYFIEL